MKTYIYSLLILILFSSCKTVTVYKTFLVYYEDGTHESITLSSEVLCFKNADIKHVNFDIYFNNGCLYKKHQETEYGTNYQGCIRCGVKYYKVIEKTVL